MDEERTFKRTLAIDPGGRNLGWAIAEGRTLVAAGLSRATGPTGVANYMKIHCAHLLEVAPVGSIDRVVVEQMQSYGDLTQQKGDQNDLIMLSLIGGAVAGLYWNPELAIDTVTPRTWKGQTPKDIQAHRNYNEAVARGCASVYKKELAKVSKSLAHNVEDAIGILFWATRKKGEE